MYLIYVTRFFSSLAISSVLPLYSLWLHGMGLFTITQIATLVTVLVLSKRMMSFFVSPFMDLISEKHMTMLMQAIASACIIILYFLSLFKIDHFSLWLIITLLFGSTISITTIALLSIISRKMVNKHIQGFSYSNMALNVSSGIGPVLAGIFLFYVPHYYLVIPLLASIVAFSLSLSIPGEKRTIRHVPKIEFKSLFTISDRRILLLLLLEFLFMFAYAQFYETFPLLAKTHISPASIGAMFLLVCALVVIMQIPISKFLTNKLWPCLLFSHILYMIGIGSLYFISFDIYWPILFSCVFIALAEIIYAPVYKTLAVKWSREESPSITMARLNFMAGIGNSAGAFIGLLLVGHQYTLFPYIMAVGAMIIAITLLFYNKSLFKSVT